MKNNTELNSRIPLVSVIVPIYNSEKYLSDCINSILTQTFRNIEIILVNDGSTDRSQSICNVFLKRDSRIKLINQINQGASQARSTGVKNAKGEWVTFVDSDDTLEKFAIQELVKESTYNTDIICGYITDQKLIIPTKLSIQKYRKLSVLGVFTSNPVGKLYHKNIFNQDTFNIHQRIIRGEDVIMNIRLAFNTKKNVIILKKRIYNYRNNPNSVTHNDTITLDDLYLRQIEHLRTLDSNIKSKYISQYVTVGINRIIPFALKNLDSAREVTQSSLFKELKQFSGLKYHISLIDRIILITHKLWLWKILIKCRVLYNRITNKLQLTIYAQTL